MARDTLPRNTIDRDAEPSKTQRKRQMHELQDVGEALVALPAHRLAGIPMPEQLRDAVMLAQRIASSREGRRRQLQYIGRLMRTIDTQPIREALARAAEPGREDAALLHAVERWRERLLAEPAALDAWQAEHGADEELVRLVEAARAEPRTPGTPGARKGRAYRDLFRRLRGALAPRDVHADASTDDTP